MEGIEIAKQYFEAWNNHNGKQVKEIFHEVGTYEDVITPKISGDAIEEMVNGLAKTYNNLKFEIRSIGEVQDNLIAAEWIMYGEYNGRSIKLEGADFIKITNEGLIRSVKGYYDSVGTSRQLGMKIITKPME